MQNCDIHGYHNYQCRYFRKTGAYAGHPPGFPVYTQSYSCTWEEGSYQYDEEVPDSPPPEENTENENSGPGDEEDAATFTTEIA